MAIRPLEALTTVAATMANSCAACTRKGRSVSSVASPRALTSRQAKTRGPPMALRIRATAAVSGTKPASTAALSIEWTAAATLIAANRYWRWCGGDNHPSVVKNTAVSNSSQGEPRARARSSSESNQVAANPVVLLTTRIASKSQNIGPSGSPTNRSIRMTRKADTNAAISRSGSSSRVRAQPKNTAIPARKPHIAEFCQIPVATPTAETSTIRARFVG